MIDSNTIKNLLIENLKHLLKKASITPIEFSRLSGISQSTIYAILSGLSLDHKISVLYSISKFFGITISQLVGEVPLNQNIHNIPLLSWNNIDHDTGNIYFQYGNDTKYISIDYKSENPLFALDIDTEISYIYKDNTVIIVEVTHHFKNFDIVLISNAKTKPVLKKIIIDGPEYYLEAFNTAIPIQKYNKDNTNVIGIVRETRIMR